MKMALRIVLLAAVCGLGFWLWTILFPSPEKIVLKKISTLATVASINPSDSNLARAGKAVRLAGFFATNAEIVIKIPNLAEHTITGREEIKESAMGGFARITTLKVQFFDATATLGPDKQSVEASCTLKVSIGNDKDYGVQELHFHFKKIDGEWLITRVETVQTLS